MPQPLTPEEKGRQILDAFANFNTKAGEGLLPGSISAYFENNRLDQQDILPGLEYAGEQEWIENGPNNFILLTANGYTQRP